MRLAMLAVVFTMFAGCEIRDDPWINAHQPEIRIGMTEQQVVALTSSSPSRRLEADRMCKEAGGVRELHFDDVLVFLGYERIRRSIGFCFSQDGKLVGASKPLSNFQDDPYLKAPQPNIEVGMTEQQVVALAGSPSRRLEADRVCKEAGGVRELLFDDVSVFGPHRIRRSAGFCFDRNGKLVDRNFFEY